MKHQKSDSAKFYKIRPNFVLGLIENRLLENNYMFEDYKSFKGQKLTSIDLQFGLHS